MGHIHVKTVPIIDPFMFVVYITYADKYLYDFICFIVVKITRDNSFKENFKSLQNFWKNLTKYYPELTLYILGPPK